MATQVTDEDILKELRGAAGWITPELMRDTLNTFEPLYAEPLTAADALEILLNVTNLYRILQEEPKDQKN